MRIRLHGVSNVPLGFSIDLEPEEWLFGLGSIIAGSVTAVTIAGGLENGWQAVSVWGMTASLVTLGGMMGVRMLRSWRRKPQAPVKGDCWWVHGWGSVEIESVTASHVHLRIEGEDEVMLMTLATFGRRATSSQTIERLQEREVIALPDHHVGLLTDTEAR